MRTTAAMFLENDGCLEEFAAAGILTGFCCGHLPSPLRVKKLLVASVDFSTGAAAVA